MAEAPLPFNRPTALGGEAERIADALAGHKLSGDGPFTARCHELLQEALGVRHVLLTTSCTHALEMSALLLGIGPGDEFVLPTFTFPSAANAFVLRGARPVFVDSRPDTLNLDEELVEAAITPRTRAVVPVHYAGVACEMEALTRLVADRGIAIVEDNAHGLFGRYRGRLLGTFGTLATLSFHETKNFTCGEGGALLVNDPRLAARAEILREKGTNRSQFFRGEVDKYTWVDIGSSFLPSDILAAHLSVQLERHAEVQQRRERIWRRYEAALTGWAARHDVALPTVPPTCEPAWHLFHLVLPTAAARDGLLAHLRQRGILAVFHYVPLHLSPMGRSFGYRAGELPVAEDRSARLLRLPFFTDMSGQEQDRVLAAIHEFVP